MFSVEYNNYKMHFFLYGDEMKCYCNSKPNEKDIVRQKRSEVSCVAPFIAWKWLMGTQNEIYDYHPPIFPVWVT